MAVYTDLRVEPNPAGGWVRVICAELACAATYALLQSRARRAIATVSAEYIVTVSSIACLMPWPDASLPFCRLTLRRTQHDPVKPLHSRDASGGRC